MRFLSYKVEQRVGLFSWGGPPELIDIFHDKHSVLTEQLFNTIQKIDLAKDIDRLQLELHPLSPEDPQSAYESLTEYTKRKRAKMAVHQIKNVVQESFILEHLDALGGQVIYVVPQILNSQL